MGAGSADRGWRGGCSSSWLPLLGLLFLALGTGWQQQLRERLHMDRMQTYDPQLLYRAPEWLDEPRGPDLSPDMSWYPGVTFWQTVVDLGFSTTVPTGHGHVYGSGVADAWAALLQPPDWTTEDTVRLRARLDTPLTTRREVSRI